VYSSSTSLVLGQTRHRPELSFLLLESPFPPFSSHPHSCFPTLVKSTYDVEYGGWSPDLSDIPPFFPTDSRFSNKPSIHVPLGRCGTHSPLPSLATWTIPLHNTVFFFLKTTTSPPLEFYATPLFPPTLRDGRFTAWRRNPLTFFFRFSSRETSKLLSPPA